ncbi:hypothetical protein SAMN05192533_10179 [Mesobacillus persicus]|uniref:Uncharacterized protein n=1 Tax=Mesobacillus persicus TaxID=930146 RepID=A0A1H7VRJ2_9BACI|nr:hypothetical protein [Mesobacillus persicus]SEM11873.1 hypothetical protein SAMN05192533_10179 [Mesobacillus persicus]
MTEKNRETMKDVLLKLPPNYIVGALYVNGANIPVARFINYSKGLAYFIGPDLEVILIDGDKIDGMSFTTEACCGDEEEEFESF